MKIEGQLVAPGGSISPRPCDEVIDQSIVARRDSGLKVRPWHGGHLPLGQEAAYLQPKEFTPHRPDDGTLVSEMSNRDGHMSLTGDRARTELRSWIIHKRLGKRPEEEIDDPVGTQSLEDRSRRPTVKRLPVSRGDGTLAR